MGILESLKPSVSSNPTQMSAPAPGSGPPAGTNNPNNDDDFDSEGETLEAQRSRYDHDIDTSNQEDDAAERALDKDLEWAGRKLSHEQKFPPLRRPVIIPQTAPGLVNLFKRAWAPDLMSHDVRPEEWMQFIDHLNVCKTGTPPLQVLNLAGTVVGFVPVHYAAIAGIATNVVAVGGMYAVSRVRITRYLKRANEEYFVPRGLVARIAKQNTIHEITGQSPDAPVLSQPSGDPAHLPDVIDRRMEAFQGSVAPLEYNGVPPMQQEQSALDKATAKMNAMKANRGSKKDAQGNTISKHQAKLNESRAERDEEAAKIHRKAEKEMAKKPKDAPKIEKKMNKELRKLDEDAQSDEEEYLEKSGKGGEKVDKKVRRLMFIAVQNLDDYMRQQAQAQGNEALR